MLLHAERVFLLLFAPHGVSAALTCPERSSPVHAKTGSARWHKWDTEINPRRKSDTARRSWKVAVVKVKGPATSASARQCRAVQQVQMSASWVSSRPGTTYAVPGRRRECGPLLTRVCGGVCRWLRGGAQHPHRYTMQQVCLTPDLNPVWPVDESAGRCKAVSKGCQALVCALTAVARSLMGPGTLSQGRPKRGSRWQHELLSCEALGLPLP